MVVWKERGCLPSAVEPFTKRVAAVLGQSFSEAETSKIAYSHDELDKEKADWSASFSEMILSLAVACSCHSMNLAAPIYCPSNFTLRGGKQFAKVKSVFNERNWFEELLSPKQRKFNLLNQPASLIWSMEPVPWQMFPTLLLWRWATCDWFSRRKWYFRNDDAESISGLKKWQFSKSQFTILILRNHLKQFSSEDWGNEIIVNWKLEMSPMLAFMPWYKVGNYRMKPFTWTRRRKLLVIEKSRKLPVNS